MENNVTTSIDLTENALKRILDVIKNYSNSSSNFRVFVTGGGCSGFQYGFKFDEFDKEEDSLLDFENGVSIILDQLSYPYLLGSKIDYKEDLMGAKFTVENPNASSTCGCGASFSI